MRPRRSSLLILAAFLVARCTAEVLEEASWKGFSVACSNEEKGHEVANASVSCHGIRLVRRIVQKLLEEAKRKRSLEILDGVSLVESEDDGNNSRGGRVLKGFGQIGSIMSFFENRELRIKLPSILPANLEAAIERSLPSTDQSKGRGGGGGGFGGGKKGDNGVMLMALMMGKMMAAMGFGALALLAMKALMVSALALMLSLIVAAKKLAGHKEEEGHHIVYAQEVGHHRRRRDLQDIEDDLKSHPYRGHIGLPAEVHKLRW